MDMYSNDVSRTSSEGRTASVSSRNSTAQPPSQPDVDPLSRKLKQIADIEAKYKQQPARRKPDNIMRAKRFLK